MRVRVDLKGVHIGSIEMAVICTSFAFLNSLKKAPDFLYFDVESIVKYSYNHSNKTFTFCEMQKDGSLKQYKLQSDQVTFFILNSIFLNLPY